MTSEGRKTAPRAPNGLAAEGRKLWKSVASEYDLRPDEASILARCAKMADRIAVIDAELDGAEQLTEGSRGQQRANPLLSELRLLEGEYGRLLRSLRLPDYPEASRTQQRSWSAREAARARWTAVL